VGVLVCALVINDTRISQIKKMGAARATRIVRDELGGFSVRDDNVNVVELSSSISKRGLHKRFCMPRGWEPETYSMGKMKMIEL
jgi:hypothetical protein